MSCDETRTRLTAYLDGDLDPDRGTVVRGHLRTCEACRRIAEDEAALRDGLRALPTVDPPSTLWANVQARLAAAEVAESELPAWRRALTRVQRWLPAPQRLAIGGALAAAAVALVVWRIGPSAPAERAPVAEAPLVGPRVADHPSPEIQSSAKLPVAPATTDATADLLAEPARITASYEASAQELLVLATEARPGWSDDAKAAFDDKVRGYRDAIAKAPDERARQKSYRAMIRYVQNAVVRDEIMLARAP